MTAVQGRRKVAAEALASCPAGQWFSVDDFFQMMRVTGKNFSFAHDYSELYIAEQYYGHLGYSSDHAWEQLQGRFVLAFLFEYAATLGLIDVAYIPPQGVRNDFHDRWGTDEYDCLSRYDGLLSLRINPLGAWLFGLVKEYHPATSKRSDFFLVLSNLDVVVSNSLPAADKLTLDRFADRESDGVWKLSGPKILSFVEQGGTIGDLEQFLSLRIIGELPSTVAVFLADMRKKAGRLIDAGPAHLIECADQHLAVELVSQRQLKGKCLRAGERFVVVRNMDLEGFRKVVRRLGFVWPLANSD